MTGFNLTRRDILAGVLVLAAPAIIRIPGLLMPVRDRAILSASDLEWESILGTRDYRKYPLTVAEVKAWRRSMSDRAARRVMVNWTGEGFMRIQRMSEAEKRFEAMGLL